MKLVITPTIAAKTEFVGDQIGIALVGKYNCSVYVVFADGDERSRTPQAVAKSIWEWRNNHPGLLLREIRVRIPAMEHLYDLD